MKKLTSFLLTLLLIGSVLSPAFPAWGAEKTLGSAQMENPLYAEGITMPLLTSNNNGAAYISPSRALEYNGHTYYSLGTELYEAARKALDERQNQITLYYLSKTEIVSASLFIHGEMTTIFTNATSDELSQTSTDGDYLRWSISSYGFENLKRDAKKNGYYLYRFDARFFYYMSAAEEQQVDEVIQTFIRSLDTNAMSDVEIIRAVEDFICSRTQYNYPATEKPTEHLYAYTPYGALVKGTCVCQGYATAFYRICKELGYTVRVAVSNPESGNHAWNLIGLDGKYYFVDCTWDDQIRDENINGFDDYTYFLVDYPTVQKYDVYFAGAHKLYSAYFDTPYFQQTYRAYFAQENYDFNNAHQLSNCKLTLSQKEYFYDGSAKTPEVTVLDMFGNAVASFSVAYHSNLNTGTAYAEISGLDAYTGSSRRPFRIYPAAVTGLKVTAVSDSSLTLTWHTDGAPAGYEIECYQNGAWRNAGYSETNSLTVKSLSPAAKQTFRIRSYQRFSKQQIFSAYSEPIYHYTNPKKVSVKKLSAGKKSAVLTWKKVKCDGYEIRYSVNKSMKNAKTVKVNKKATAKTIKKLKKGKKYYVQIRAYKKYTTASGKSKTQYGKRSAKKSVKVQ